MNLHNQVVVLTGAASGIGRALASKLVLKGCHLALVDRDASGLEKTVQGLPETDRRVTSHVLDLLDKEAIKALPTAVLSQHPVVNLLINNAGVGLGGNFTQVGEDDFDWVMAINFNAVVTATRAFLPHLLATGTEARIVNLSSLYGLISPPGQTAYSASKFAVRGFSNALRFELQNTKVGVSVVHPGGIATSIADNARVPEGPDAEQIRQQKNEAKRMLTMPPERAAAIIVKGIEGRRARILVGFDALLLCLIERLMPVRYWTVIEQLMRLR